MNEPATIAQPPADLTTSAFWDREWEGWHARVVADWQRRAARRRKPRPLIKLLSRCLDECRASAGDVLELGCAPGSILAQLHAQQPEHRFHGLDFAAEGLERTAAFFQAVDIPATFYCGDLRQFEPPRRFDLVYSCGLVEHFSDPAAVVAHHARLCAPGGTVLITVPNYRGTVQEWVIRRLHPEKLATHNLAVMHREALRRMMEAAGLEDVTTGGLGRGKFSVSCQIRNPWTFTVRLGAKTWNALHDALPLAPHWHSALWAAGRAPKAASVHAA